MTRRIHGSGLTARRIGSTVPEPRSLSVILTSRCNLTCSYCYQNDKSSRRMAWSTLQGALDVLLRSSTRCLQVEFVGGEPLLEFPLLRRAVEYLDRHLQPGRRADYTVITNGLLLDREKAAFLARRGIQTQISSDGSPAAMRLRGARAFEALDRTFDWLRRDYRDFWKERVSVRGVLVPSTVPHLADSISYLIGKGFEDIAVTAGDGQEKDWRVERIDELDRQYARVYDLCLRHYEETGRVPLTLFRKFGADRPADGNRSRPMCGAVRGSGLTVDVDGQTFGCVAFAESYQVFPSEFLRSRLSSLRIGDVRRLNLGKRLTMYEGAVERTGLFHRKENKRSSYGTCGTCRYLEECDICPVGIGLIPGNTDPDRVPDFPCAVNLVSLKYRERFPAQSASLARLRDLLAKPRAEAPGADAGSSAR